MVETYEVDSSTGPMVYTPFGDKIAIARYLAMEKEDLDNWIQRLRSKGKDENSDGEVEDKLFVPDGKRRQWRSQEGTPVKPAWILGRLTVAKNMQLSVFDIRYKTPYSHLESTCLTQTLGGLENATLIEKTNDPEPDAKEWEIMYGLASFGRDFTRNFYDEYLASQHKAGRWATAMAWLRNPSNPA